MRDGNSFDIVMPDGSLRNVNAPVLPGIKERDLVKLGKCAICGEHLLGKQPVGITFYRLRLERAMFNPQALRRRVGLELQIGPLATVMGPDEDLASVFDGPTEVVVHEDCAAKVGHLLRLFPGAE